MQIKLQPNYKRNGNVYNNIICEYLSLHTERLYATICIGIIIEKKILPIELENDVLTMADKT